MDIIVVTIWLNQSNALISAESETSEYSMFPRADGMGLFVAEGTKLHLPAGLTATNLSNTLITDGVAGFLIEGDPKVIAKAFADDKERFQVYDHAALL